MHSSNNGSPPRSFAIKCVCFLEIFVCASFVYYVHLYLFAYFGCCSLHSPVTDKQHFISLCVFSKKKEKNNTINLN